MVRIATIFYRIEATDEHLVYGGFNQTGSNFAEFQPAPNSHRHEDPSQEFVTKLKAWAAHVEVVARASQNSSLKYAFKLFHIQGRVV